jgi:hypothetical protein
MVKGPVLVVTGLGNDYVKDGTTDAFNNMIDIRGHADTVQGGLTNDLSDVLYFGGASLNGTLTLDGSGHATDSFGRTYSMDSSTHNLVITDNAGDTVSILHFAQGDFGLTFDKDFHHVITFSEFPEETSITTQYENKGIIFGGSGAFITSDGSNSTSPVLSGSPLFEGSITGQFVVPGSTTPATVNEFALDAGYFNDLHSTKLTWYDASGHVIGSETDSQIGIQHFDIVSNIPIASWTMSEVAQEDAGFAIDNVSFGTPHAVATPHAVEHDIFGLV